MVREGALGVDCASLRSCKKLARLPRLGEPSAKVLVAQAVAMKEIWKGYRATMGSAVLCEAIGRI